MFARALLLSWLLALFATSCHAFRLDWRLPSRLIEKRAVGSHYMFLFGDSYTRVEFNNQKKAPNSANPIGNPAFPGTTTSGGANWGVMLGSKYNTSMTLIYDYAYGGAPINQTLIKPPDNVKVNDLNNQVNLFKKNMTVTGAPKWSEPHRSLFATWFGQNDVYQAWNRSYADPNSTFDTAFDYYFERMDDLYTAGARDFLWIGVAPIKRTPLVLSSTADNQTKIAQMSLAFNDRLQTAVKNFTDTHSGLTWRYYDPSWAFNRVLNNPTKYGCASNNVTCYSSDGTTCAWWNHFHPGMHIHEQVAADIAGNNTFPVLFNTASS